VLVEQWPDLAFGLGDGAGDDTEEFGEDKLGVRKRWRGRL
jgi:hypothetical protein